jgi:threonine/homoserine/homoserine lactone efflux protein
MFPLIFSPGPANIVCTMAGIKQGVKKSIPLITGINVVSILYSLLVEIHRLYSNYKTTIIKLKFIFTNDKNLYLT